MSLNDKPKKNKELQTVNDALGYTDDDFKANLDGHLSTHQRRQFNIKRLVLGAIWVPLLLLLVFLGRIVTTGVVMLSSPEEALGMLLVAAPVLLAFFAVSYHFWKTHMDLHNNRVEMIEGVVRQVIDDNFYRRSSGILHVGNRKFLVDLPVLLAFQNGHPYRLYFMPHTNTLLAAEPIVEEHPFEARGDAVDEADDIDRIPAEDVVAQQLRR